MNNQFVRDVLSMLLEILFTIIVFIALGACIHIIPMHAIVRTLELPGFRKLGPRELVFTLFPSSLLVAMWIMPSCILALCSVGFRWMLPTWSSVKKSLAGLPIALVTGYAIACELLSYKHVVGRSDYLVMLASICLISIMWLTGSMVSFRCLRTNKVGESHS
jgi:hypothetical protein